MNHRHVTSQEVQPWSRIRTKKGSATTNNNNMTTTQTDTITNSTRISTHPSAPASSLPSPRRRSRHCLVLLVSTLVASISLIRLVQSCYTIERIILLDTPSSALFGLSHYKSARVATFFLENEPFLPLLGRTILLDGPPDVDFHDTTQYYHRMDSSDAEDTLERRIFPEHETSDTCEPMSQWQTTFYPTCNEFHHHSMTISASEETLSVLSTKGFWRYAWEYREPPFDSNSTTAADSSSSSSSSVVFKNLKLDHSYEDAYFENNRVDAIAMERLTASPYVVDIYGYCGMSVYTEYAGETISTVADKLASVDKLRLAKQVAQGVADVHGIDGSSRISLVHNDLNFANIVISEQTGLPLINDFNVAILQMQDHHTKETCPFTSHYPNPQWRSPEEQVDEETGESSTTLTEKVDIYGLGNVLYRFAVGMSPWKKKGGGSLSKEEKSKIASAKLKDGALPYIPSAVRKDEDPAIQSLLRIMRECYRHRPELRPTAQEVVDMLEEAIEQVSDTSKAELEDQRRM